MKEIDKVAGEVYNYGGNRKVTNLGDVKQAVYKPKVTVEVEVSDCRDCPYKGAHRGQGECWTECNHKDHKQEAYGNILWGCQAEFEKVPDWCPIGLANSRSQ